jgi:NAD(P)H-dependent FMN reductase
MNIAAISLSASNLSTSRKSLEFIQSIKTDDVTLSYYDIRDLPPMWMDQRPINEFPDAYQVLFNSVKNSSGIIFFVPIYNYTISSTAKFIIEVLGDSMKGKPVAVIYSSGSSKGFLSIADFIKSLILEQRIYLFPTMVNINKVHIQGEGEFNDEIRRRILDFFTDFKTFCKKLT